MEKKMEATTSYQVQKAGGQLICQFAVVSTDAMLLQTVSCKLAP